MTGEFLRKKHNEYHGVTNNINQNSTNIHDYCQWQLLYSKLTLEIITNLGKNLEEMFK